MLLKPVITWSLLDFPNHLCFLHYQAGLNIFNLLTQISVFSCKYLHRLTPEIFFLPLPGLIPIRSSVLHLQVLCSLGGAKCLRAGLAGYIAAVNTPNLFPSLCLQALGVLSPGSVLSHWLCAWPCGTIASVTPLRDLKKCLHFGVCPLLPPAPPLHDNPYQLFTQ